MATAAVVTVSTPVGMDRLVGLALSLQTILTYAIDDGVNWQSAGLGKVASAGARSMSGTRKRLLAILPDKWAESIEAESRTWMMRCPNCEHEVSVWEAGGVRWKAAGRSKRLLRCQACDQVGMHLVYRRDVT